MGSGQWAVKSKSSVLLVACSLLPTAHCLLPTVFQYSNYSRLNRLACDDGVAFGDVDIYLGAHAELAFEINTGLDGKGGARDDAARVAGLQIVYVRAVAVNLFADGVACAVQELRAIACPRLPPRHVVNVRALNGTSRA